MAIYSRPGGCCCQITSGLIRNNNLCSSGHAEYQRVGGTVMNEHGGDGSGNMEVMVMGLGDTSVIPLPQNFH